MTTRRIEITCSPNVDNLDEDRRITVEAPSGVSMDDLLNTATAAAHALAAAPSAPKPWTLSDLAKLKEDWGKGDAAGTASVGEAEPDVAVLLGEIGKGGRPIPARVAALLTEARLVDSRIAAGEAPPLSVLEQVRVAVIDRLYEFDQAVYRPWTDEVQGRVLALRGVLAEFDARLGDATEAGGDDLKEGDSIYV